MKKIILLLFVLFCNYAFVSAQLYKTEDYKQYSGWFVNINGSTGTLSQNIAQENFTNNYLNPLNVRVDSQMKFASGSSFGLEFQGGYFFAPRRKFGFGTGLFIFYQQGDISINNNFHVEFQSVDNKGNIFRQLVTANTTYGPIIENISIRNYNIPLLFKYRTGFSHKLDFNLDAGFLINIQYKNSYTTNASFDYEAIYKHANDNIFAPYVYDNSPTPDNQDNFITQAKYKNASAASFANWARQGALVALAQQPNNSSGSYSFATGNIGFTIRPAVSFHFSKSLDMNVGAYYTYQSISNNVSSSYVLTGKPGDYNSLLGSISNTSNQSFGVNIGLMYLFRTKDIDHDGIPNRLDLCPNDSGARIFKGCPDSDGDGIGDPEDSCPHIPGPLTNFGCPIGTAPTKGYAVHEEKIIEPKLIENITDYPLEKRKRRKITNIDDNVVQFESGEATIKKSSYGLLNRKANMLKKQSKAVFVISGYADNQGDEAINKKLSKSRAEAVKKYLIKKGIPARRLIIKANGSKKPIASNKTEKGRAKNRRVELKLTYSDED